MNKPPFDWSYIYYVARNKLGMTEEEFWESSLEKINDLTNVYGALHDEKKMNKRQNELRSKSPAKGKELFIDEVSWF